MPARPRLIFLLSSAQRRLQQWMASVHESEARSGRTIPTPAQSGVLFVLARQDGVTMGALALALDLAPSAVSGLVQRMELLGWVERRSCEMDARTQRVWLCPNGSAQLPEVRRALAQINERLTSSFTDEELQTVARWLRHVQTLGEIDE